MRCFSREICSSNSLAIRCVFVKSFNPITVNIILPVKAFTYSLHYCSVPVKISPALSEWLAQALHMRRSRSTQKVDRLLSTLDPDDPILRSHLVGVSESQRQCD